MILLRTTIAVGTFVLTANSAMAIEIPDSWDINNPFWQRTDQDIEKRDGKR